MSLTLADITHAFGRLQAAGLPLPPTWETLGRAKITEEWIRGCGQSTTRADLDAAVTAYCRSDRRYWPTPGQLLGLVPSHAQAHGDSWREPDLRAWDWYALRPGSDGPVVRFLPDAEARRRGLAPASAATCPVEGCECEAVEVRILSAALFGGTFGRVLRDVPPRRWLWPHHAVGLPATAYRIVGR